MSRVLRVTVPPERAGQRVSTVLRGELSLSRSLLQSLKWTPGAICLDGVPVKAASPVPAGAVLTVTLPEQSGDLPPSGPVEELRVVWEDDDLLVIDKPAGVFMHAKTGGSLAEALRAHLGDGTPAHFVNRLDKGTSGLLIAAKSGYVHDRFRRMLHTEALLREYRGVVLGVPEPPEGRIELPLGPDPDRFYARCVRPDGCPALSDYALLERAGDLSLLRLLPRTGRTHQLRVHLSAVGCPLCGDTLYGAPEDGRIARPALHSCRLRFDHPITGERLEFTAPLPEDMERLMHN